MKRMAVHNGIFHADDVFGVALMQSIYNDLEIIRTRDEELLKTCDIVSDVGNTLLWIWVIMERFWYIIYKCKIPRSI